MVRTEDHFLLLNSFLAFICTVLGSFLKVVGRESTFAVGMDSLFKKIRLISNPAYSSLETNEILKATAKGVGIYHENERLSDFDNGIIHITNHRIIWSNSMDSYELKLSRIQSVKFLVSINLSRMVL